jgi:sulfate permease, SulP family
LIRSLSGFSLNNLTAGLIVATVALPLCIAFSIASGASPMAGIVSGVLGGALAALFGSSRFQVSGPAAAFITVIAGIIATYGLPVLLAATLCAGLLVVALGVLRLGRLMEFMPHPIIVGFTTGIGVLILLGQIPVALGIAVEGENVLAKLAHMAGNIDSARFQEVAVLTVALGSALLHARTRFARWVPAPLVGLAAGTLIAEILALSGLPIHTIGAAYDISIDGLTGSAEFLQSILTEPSAVAISGLTLALLIAVESLLSAKALDSLTGSNHNPNRELIGLGLANIAVPFLGGIPVSGVIVRGSTNVMSGASERTAALAHSVFLGLFIAVLAAIVARLPMAALAAVLVMTALRLIEIDEIKRIHRFQPAESRLAILTAVLTVSIDLTVSVPVGVALTLLLALRRMLQQGSVAVRQRHGRYTADPGPHLTFLTGPRLRPQIEAALQTKDNRVDALDLSRVASVDATGLAMVADVAARHPHIDVWVAQIDTAEALSHAGVPEERIQILGSGLVRLRDVFETLQSDRTPALAAGAASSS